MTTDEVVMHIQAFSLLHKNPCCEDCQLKAAKMLDYYLQLYETQVESELAWL